MQQETRLNTKVVGSNIIDTGHMQAQSEGGGGAVLLTNLVAGWALTAGPQQTLSSAGVVASGPRDWSESEPLSYGAAGVAIAPGQALFQAFSSAYDIEGRDCYISAICKLVGVGDGFPLTSDFGNLVLGLNTSTTRAQFKLGEQPDGGTQNIVTSGAGTVADNVSIYVAAAFDNAAATVRLQLNNGTVLTSVGLANYFDDPGDALAVAGGAGATMHVKYLRLWVGANALTIANSATYRTWLYNAGAGRDDAAVAAYTG